MGYAKRKRLSHYSGAPVSGHDLELRQERQHQGPKLVEYTCPRCSTKALAPLNYRVAVCEPPIEDDMARWAVSRGANAEEIKSRKGCGWLLKLEPNAAGDAFTVDDVAHVGPWRPSRNPVIVALIGKVMEDWERRGVAQQIIKRMKAIRREGEVTLN